MSLRSTSEFIKRQACVRQINPTLSNENDMVLNSFKFWIGYLSMVASGSDIEFTATLTATPPCVV